MNKEFKAIIMLVVSIITFAVLLPFIVTMGVLRVAKSILTILENTIGTFVSSVRNELLKQ
jgi:hypothetical protein|tara:strand:- start:1530 stop:1709 length:180 start_codon:yes stop_codon:yes gene_type:complete